MRQAWVLWLSLIFIACSEKGPADGAIRVSVRYGSYRPACLRVVVRDAQGHEARTDIAQSRFKKPGAKEVLVAVYRKPEWERDLTVEVFSHDGSSGEECAGTVVEKRSTPGPITVPLEDFASVQVTLQAQDGDGDSFTRQAEGVTGTDCDDEREDVYPGAPEQCSADTDFDCDGARSCQDSKCLAKTCDDGVACTVNDVCQSVGACLGVQTPCTASNVCRRVVGGCPALGNCMEELDPSKVNTACVFVGGRPGVCRDPDGACSTFPYVPSHFDPDAIPESRIGTLTTTCAVTFDSGALTWAPLECVSNPPQPTVVSQGTERVVLAMTGMNLGGDLRLVGTRPVILAVYGDATLNHSILANGAIDAGGMGTTPGAGGNQGCDDRRGADGVSRNGAGGGGGAGGGTVGADGGRGTDSGATGGKSGGAWVSGVVPLVGGCPGGSGGGPSGVAGKGGAGGGAVQLSVAGTLTVNRWITASGSGGLGGRYATNQAAGGGGGGSGGVVLLEARQLLLASEARLTANGGGGGQGGGYLSEDNANVGANGEDGPRSSATQAAGGSGGSISGGAGGKGGAGGTPPGIGSAGASVFGSRGGGGGGGGAVGHIRLRSLQPCTLDAASIISPPANRQCPL